MTDLIQCPTCGANFTAEQLKKGACAYCRTVLPHAAAEIVRQHGRPATRRATPEEAAHINKMFRDAIEEDKRREGRNRRRIARVSRHINAFIWIVFFLMSAGGLTYGIYNEDSRMIVASVVTSVFYAAAGYLVQKHGKIPNEGS